ncbi:MAG: hypothetical protein ACREUU_02330, partial [Gammaproteobacteria bacterium]
ARFDFGPFREKKNPYQHDGWVNLGPRAGFAYNIDGRGKTVIRGGWGVLFTPQMPAVVRQAAANRDIPFRIRWSRAEAQRLNLRWPMYTDEMAAIAERDIAASGRKFVFSVLNPGLQNPYTMHYQLNVQRALTNTLMIESGYVGVRGVKFVLHRRFNEVDRFTGERPNPNIIPGGYYVDNTQNTVYNAWQTSLRKRFSQGLTFDFHYTWGKGLGVTGGDVGAYYGADADVAIQEFTNPKADRSVNTGDATHRFHADWIYELPFFRTSGHPFLRHTIGGWQVSGIFSNRSGEPINITQSCASDRHCRPDYVGGKPIIANFRNTQSSRCVPGARCGVNYLNLEAFRAVPVNSRSQVTVRPGTLGAFALRNPSTWSVDLSLAKNLRIREGLSLQIRADAFNALNHVNYGGPGTGINSNRFEAETNRILPGTGSFGEINGAGGMRVIQLNARLSF